MFGIIINNLVDCRTLLLPYNYMINPLKKNIPASGFSNLGFSKMSESLT